MWGHAGTSITVTWTIKAAVQERRNTDHVEGGLSESGRAHWSDLAGGREDRPGAFLIQNSVLLVFRMFGLLIIKSGHVGKQITQGVG